MRQVTFNESINEIEIHPPETYQTFQSLAKQSLNDLDRNQFTQIDHCPACNSRHIIDAFTLWNLTYKECEECASLFVSNRPSAEQLNWYLDDSQTARYRTSHEYRTAMQSNYTKLSSYRASWIAYTCLRIPAGQKIRIVDLETRSFSLVEAIRHQVEAEICSVHPAFLEAESIEKLGNIEEVEDQSATILTAFDILEHQHSPAQFFEMVAKKVIPGGYFLLTTRAGSGFDIQILREHCPTIVPIEHLNLLSVEGIQHLLSKVGFDVLEISTPGQLDVQIIERVMRSPTPHQIPKAVQYFLEKRDMYAKQNLQQFLQTNLLSSHLRLVAQKKE